MDPQSAVWRLYIHKTLYARVQEANQGREEALRETLSALRPDLAQATVADVSAKVPPLLPDMHRGWISAFVDRLFETAAPEQIAHLCDGTSGNDAALALAYVMFLESERMEMRMAEDFKAMGMEGCDAAALAQAAAALSARAAGVDDTAAGQASGKLRAN